MSLLNNICYQSQSLQQYHMSIKVSQIPSNSTICSTSHSCKQQRKHQSGALLALSDGNPPVTGGFPSQRASNSTRVSMPWHHQNAENSAIGWISFMRCMSLTFTGLFPTGPTTETFEAFLAKTFIDYDSAFYLSAKKYHTICKFLDFLLKHITAEQTLNFAFLTHWGRVMHICISKLTIIGSDNGLLPGQCRTIIWTNAGILLIWPLGTNFSEILIKILTFSFKKMHWKCRRQNGCHFVLASMC